jgi:hypothetical protein
MLLRGARSRYRRYLGLSSVEHIVNIHRNAKQRQALPHQDLHEAPNKTSRLSQPSSNYDQRTCMWCTMNVRNTLSCCLSAVRFEQPAHTAHHNPATGCASVTVITIRDVFPMHLPTLAALSLVCFGWQHRAGLLKFAAGCWCCTADWHTLTCRRILQLLPLLLQQSAALRLSWHMMPCGLQMHTRHQSVHGKTGLHSSHVHLADGADLPWLPVCIMLHPAVHRELCCCRPRFTAAARRLHSQGSDMLGQHNAQLQTPSGRFTGAWQMADHV